MKDITVVVINYNGMATVLDTIESVFQLEGVDPRVIVLDDGSTDGSPAAVRENFPDVRIYEEPENTREVNRLRNKGLRFATTDKVFITDNDVIFDSRCVIEMLSVMEAQERVGACIPRLMYLQEKSRIYSEGGKIHYLGATIAPTRNLSEENRSDRPRIAVGGGIALFDKEKLEQVGGFDEDYELAWGDDGELHHRLLLVGYKCVYVPSAVGYHEHKPFDETRYYRASGQLHNRWRFIVTHYAQSTLILIAPALVVFECLQALFYLFQGIPHTYYKGTREAIRRLPAMLKRREEVQALRVVGDRALLFSGPLYVRSSGGVGGKLVAIAVMAVSFLFTAYWHLVRRFLPGDCSVPDVEDNNAPNRMRAAVLHRKSVSEDT
jgi:GT2 family glycosyltransferase